MHIVFLTNEYPKKGTNSGGIGSFVHFLAHQLISKDIKVSVIGINSNHTNEEEIDSKVEVYRLAKSNWKFAKFHQNSKRILKKIEEINRINTIDIVEGSELSFAFFPSDTPYRKVIRLHGGHHFFAIELNKKPALWRGYQEKESFKKAESFVAVSNYVGMKTQQYLKYDFEYTTIFNCVSVNKFKKANESLIIEKSLLFIGTVCEKKGIRQLVQAIPIVKNKIPDITLSIVGRDWSFPNGKSYTNYLKTFIPHEIEAAINIVGPIPHNEIPSYIEKAHICVFPSHMESFGLVVLEALNMGKPVIASNIKPFCEIIKDKKTGILVDPFSPNDIAEKIINLLGDNEKSKELGNCARKDMLKRFNTDSIVNQNLEFYKSIL